MRLGEREVHPSGAMYIRALGVVTDVSYRLDRHQPKPKVTFIPHCLWRGWGLVNALWVASWTLMDAHTIADPSRWRPEARAIVKTQPDFKRCAQFLSRIRLWYYHS